MVYGNSGDDSGTGVAFTRDPASGENVFYGEFLVNAQGEDVVSGVRTPRPVAELREVFPEVYDQLMEVRQTLEHEMRDMQDFEFTVERGRSTCCRRATASARVWRPSASPWTWPRRA